MSTQLKHFLHHAQDFLIHAVDPVAHQIDFDAVSLQSIYRQWVALGALKFWIPTEFGGLGAQLEDWVPYNVMLSQHSGALLFLQAQHQYGIFQLKNFLPEAQCLPIYKLICQENIGFAYALAANRGIIKAVRSDAGFYLSGTLRWVSGFDFFQKILLSFDCENRTYILMLPFEKVSEQGEAWYVSEPINTSVFNAINTVSVALQNYYVAEACALEYHEVLPLVKRPHASLYSLTGVSKALLKLAQTGKYADLPAARDAFDRLSISWHEHYQKLLVPAADPYHLRTQSVALAEDCAKLARIVCASEGLLSEHPLSRLQREIWQYTIAAYNVQQCLSYLEQLSS